MSDIKKWGADDSQKFTDTSKGKLTYRIYIDGVIAEVAMFKAAPDMYKALERAVEIIEAEFSYVEPEILVALAKARGECHE